MNNQYKKTGIDGPMIIIIIIAILGILYLYISDTGNNQEVLNYKGDKIEKVNKVLGN